MISVSLSENAWEAFYKVVTHLRIKGELGLSLDCVVAQRSFSLFVKIKCTNLTRKNELFY